MIHDLPSRETDAEMPVLGPRYGMWRFSRWNEANGSDAEWSEPTFDDSNWQSVRGGVDWRVASGYNDTNATGWYRQKVTVPDNFLNSSGLVLSLGVIAGADVAPRGAAPRGTLGVHHLGRMHAGLRVGSSGAVGLGRRL